MIAARVFDWLREVGREALSTHSPVEEVSNPTLVVVVGTRLLLSVHLPTPQGAIFNLW